MAAAGVTPGRHDHGQDGLTYTWPDRRPVEPDNIEAGGQTMPLAATAGATKIGILGSATNARPGARATSPSPTPTARTQTIHLGLTDWTLGAGAFPPAFGNTTAVTTPYRATSSGGTQAVGTYLFTTDAALTAGKTVQSITLPGNLDQGQFHVFSIAVG